MAYFIGDQLQLAFVFTSDDFRVVPLPADYPLADWCRQLCRSIYGESPDGLPTQNAHRLCQKLVQPLEPLPEQLTVIPDGPLYYLPFEVLLSDLLEHRRPSTAIRICSTAIRMALTAFPSPSLHHGPAAGGGGMLVVALSFGPAQETPLRQLPAR